LVALCHSPCLRSRRERHLLFAPLPTQLHKDEFAREVVRCKFTPQARNYWTQNGDTEVWLCDMTYNKECLLIKCRANE